MFEAGLSSFKAQQIKKERYQIIGTKSEWMNKENKKTMP